MQRHYAVYALLHVSTEATGHGQWLKNKHFYVGSTAVGIHSKRDARWRNHAVSNKDNLSMRSWLCSIHLHSRDLLHEVAIVPCLNFVNAADTRSRKAEVLRNWRPIYNHPWNNKLHPTSALGTAKLCITQSCTLQSQQDYGRRFVENYILREFSVHPLFGFTVSWMGFTCDVCSWRTTVL